MPRLTKIYTRKGDDGTTALQGRGRILKSSDRVEAFGNVDELNTLLGNALSIGLSDEVSSALLRVQNELFHLGSELSTPEFDEEGGKGPNLRMQHVEALEALIDALNDEVGPLENFILPGGSPGAASLQMARAVCRRAERRIVALAQSEEVRPVVLCYINRLSDALFLCARFENHRQGIEERLWDSRA